MAISLRIVTERAQEIQQSITGQFDYEGGTDKAELLYKEGIQLVEGEYMGRPILGESVISVVSELNHVVPKENIQNLPSFHRALSKAYRVFIEIAWYQSWRNKERIFNPTIEDILTNSRLIVGSRNKNEVITKFEYSCAEQAAKFFNPVTSIWDKYLELGLDFSGSAESHSIVGCLKALKTTVEYRNHDHTSSWYLDVRDLRWGATKVRTLSDFDIVIKPEINGFKEKGGKHTQCLAAVFVELLERSEVNQDVKSLATRELVYLLCLEDKDRISRAANFISCSILKAPIFRGFSEAKDRYLETRAMVGYYLKELKQTLTQDDFKALRDQALGSWIHNRTLKISEKDRLKEELLELRRGAKNREDHIFVNELGVYLQKTRGVKEDEEEVRAAKEDLRKTVTENGDIIRIFAIEAVEAADENDAIEQEVFRELESL